MSRELDPKNKPYRIAIYILFAVVAGSLAVLTLAGVIKGVYF